MPPGIRFCDLIQLLDFIYNGEINLVAITKTIALVFIDYFYYFGFLFCLYLTLRPLKT